MNENNDQNINSLNQPDNSNANNPTLNPVNEKHANMLWALVLIVMAACVFFALWYSKQRMTPTPTSYTQTTSEPAMEDAQEATMPPVIMEDNSKDEITVTEEVLVEIDELSYEDVQGAYDDQSFQDL